MRGRVRFIYMGLWRVRPGPRPITQDQAGQIFLLSPGFEVITDGD